MKLGLKKPIGIILIATVLSVFSSCANTKISDEGSELVGVFSVRKVYDAAKNVYIGKVLKIEPNTPETYSKHATLKITVEVIETRKGGFQPDDVVEDVIYDKYLYDANSSTPYPGILEVEGTYFFMTGEETSFQYGRETADQIIEGCYYQAIRLLDKHQIELYFVNTLPENHSGFEFGKKPPKSYEELLEQLTEPLPSVPTISP